MWRQNTFPESPDSDQSISDEEDFDSNWPKNCVSSSGPSEKKEELQLQLRLEILRGSHEWDCGKKTSQLSHEKQMSFPLEDDVEMPEFRNGGDFICSPRKAVTVTCNSDEERISDDEENDGILQVSTTPGGKMFHEDHLHSFGSGKRDEADTWSAVNKEAEELIRLNESASCSLSHSAYSKANKSYKGGQCKAKQKFSFHFQLHKERLSGPFISKDENNVSFKVNEAPERLETFDPRSEDRSVADVLDDFQEEYENQSEIVPAEVGALGQGCIEQSMTDLLDGLQDRTSLLKGVSKVRSNSRGKKVKLVVNRSISPLGDRTVDNEDSPDHVGSGSSSENEVKDQYLKVTIPEMKGQTMADRFQEALGATALNDEGGLVAVPRSSGIGLFGKLQQVMQSEKEREMDFLKKLQSGSNPNDELSCIVVKILTRYLDAKLTVCQCSSAENTEERDSSGQ